MEKVIIPWHGHEEANNNVGKMSEIMYEIHQNRIIEKIVFVHNFF